MQPILETVNGLIEASKKKLKKPEKPELDKLLDTEDKEDDHTCTVCQGK